MGPGCFGGKRGTYSILVSECLCKSLYKSLITTRGGLTTHGAPGQ
ncbi:unnamed protein product [Staurois parvus]|uniref:Uncharacterized protein n=1 Tax=Staurois parvus TaxID=386267 RepID=A0ABN9G8H2_9NEOB|nr:unnamed protein product [Staurois parvus]